jgi:hypothetical protein
VNRYRGSEALPGRDEGERGSALLIVFIALLSLLPVVGAMSSVLTGRSNRTRDAVNQARALLAAESGLDVAVFTAANDDLAAGSELLGSVGMASFSVQAANLVDDGLDNDDDGDTDEPDENVFRLTSTGRCAGATRRVVAHAGRAAMGLAPPPAALFTPRVTPIDIGGNPGVDGHDVLPDGSPGDATLSIPAIANAEPETLPELQARTAVFGSASVEGGGGSPPLATLPASAAVPIDRIADFVRSNWDMNLAAAALHGGTLGTIAKPKIVLREGDLALNGNFSGAGVLVVTGALRLDGGAKWVGLVIVLGELEAAGNADVIGAIAVGEACPRVRLRGTATVRYSSSALAGVIGRGGRYEVRGWQEIARTGD